MKIGLIYCSYNMEDYLQESIAPWIYARENKLDGHTFIIRAVSRQFQGFPITLRDSTTKQLCVLHSQGKIDSVEIGDSLNLKLVSECEARNSCLFQLLEDGCDLVCMIDGDEYFTIKQISDIFKYVEQDKFIAWYRISYKNYIIDDAHYISEPFTPARIYRTTIGKKWKLGKFIDDNDISYFDEEKEVSNKVLSSKTIPADIAHVRHLTWQNNLNSKRKIEYQLKRWGHCAYKWDDNLGVQVDSDYYTKLGLPIPNILSNN